MTGVYTVSGKKIFPTDYSDIDAYANNVFVTTSIPTVRGTTLQTLYKGNDKVWVGRRVYVSKAGTCALGIMENGRDLSSYFFINPDSEKTFLLGGFNDYEIGENCIHYGGTAGEIFDKDGETLVPKGKYDSIEIADGDYIICKIGHHQCIYHISNMETPCLGSEYRRYSRIKGGPGLFIVRELMPNSPYISWGYYGVISASGEILLPITHNNIEVKDGNLILSYFNTSKKDVIKIEDLIAKSNK